MRAGTFMERGDGLVVGGILVFAGLTGVLFAPIRGHEMLHVIDRFTNFLIGFVLLATLVPLVKASQHWGGHIGRNLQIIAIGLLFFMFSIVPHIEWHVAGAPAPLGPDMLALSSAWWAGFFHILTIVSWVIIIYGFYRFWEMGRPASSQAGGDSNG